MSLKRHVIETIRRFALVAIGACALLLSSGAAEVRAASESTATAVNLGISSKLLRLGKVVSTDAS